MYCLRHALLSSWNTQVLDIESLVVDCNLSRFIEGLDAISHITISRDVVPWGIIPPQPKEHKASQRTSHLKMLFLYQIDRTESVG
jgi:hypothetical protein